MAGAVNAPSVDPSQAGVPPFVGVAESVAAACEYLMSRQDAHGFWKGELRTNVTMDAEDLLLRHFLGILKPAELTEAARWISSQQREDGTWANFEGGPPDLSTTIEAYVALRLAGGGIDDPALVRARQFILARGGLEASRVFTHIWLALFGEWSWDQLPVIPPEIIRLSPSTPLNIYQWGCWARQTIVALAVVATLRPSRSLGFTVAELRTGATPSERVPVRGWTVKRGLQGLDRVLHRYERLPVKPGRQAALRRCVEWILARQEADGGWGGIQPPWVYSILALHLMGYSLDHPAVRAAIDGLEGFLIHDTGADGLPVRRLEACQSPVWDTCLAVIALVDAGMPADHPAVVRANRWLLNEQITASGDWAVRRPGLISAGWAFEFANDCYPDVDDSAEVLLALRHGTEADLPGIEQARERGLQWLVGMQSADGGWAAFDADNTSDLPLQLPFSDFGAVTDPPSADVTAHAVELLARTGHAGDQAARRGVQWLLDAQEDDGSWFGRWGANYVYGTGAAVPALIAVGIPAGSPAIQRALEWLRAHQNPDGGWGEDLRSYVDPQWRGRGASTASQTAWALLALHAADDESEAVHAGARYLTSTQLPNGGWSEDLYTGTGFPGYFYINYEMYRHVFPLSALGRYHDRFGR
jgi:squalene-hopene/tetraprenyl-beta-curcumene cyclase